MSYLPRVIRKRDDSKPDKLCTVCGDPIIYKRGSHFQRATTCGTVCGAKQAAITTNAKRAAKAVSAKSKQP